MLLIIVRNPCKRRNLIPAPKQKKDAMPVSSQRDKQLTQGAKYWLPVLICMGLIFYSSSIPGSEIPALFPFQDVTYHLFIYSLLGLCFSRALKNTIFGIGLLEAILFTTIFGIVFGVSDELHQAFIPYRNVSGLDVFIDGLGSLLGSLIQPFIKI